MMCMCACACAVSGYLWVTGLEAIFFLLSSVFSIKIMNYFVISKINRSFFGEFLLTFGTLFNVDDHPQKHPDNTCDFW